MPTEEESLVGRAAAKSRADDGRERTSSADNRRTARRSRQIDLYADAASGLRAGHASRVRQAHQVEPRRCPIYRLPCSSIHGTKEGRTLDP